MLIIHDLHVKIADKQVLNGVSLEINAGQVHAIMGPNGSGKSTLSYALTGRPGYEITNGGVVYNDQDLSDLSIEERALQGIFLAFQYPVEIPGVSYMSFLKAIVNAKRTHLGLGKLDAFDFLNLVRKTLTELGTNEEMLKRYVNCGFSGGEKKRFDILQMKLLEPKLVILDETDSGLDIDALKLVADSVNAMRTPDRSFLIITHYQRLLDYIKPDFVHIMHRGKIIESGDASLALELEKHGYKKFGINEEQAA